MSTTTKNPLGWTYAYWALLVCWLVGAGLTMARVRGGFLTSYLSDLTNPPWFYITLRGLVPGRRVVQGIRWLGRTPLMAAGSIFLVGVASELFQKWGLITGTYDPWDIAAFGAGLAVCFGIESVQTRRRGD